MCQAEECTEDDCCMIAPMEIEKREQKWTMWKYPKGSKEYQQAEKNLEKIKRSPFNAPRSAQTTLHTAFGWNRMQTAGGWLEEAESSHTSSWKREKTADLNGLTTPFGSFSMFDNDHTLLNFPKVCKKSNQKCVNNADCCKNGDGKQLCQKLNAASYDGLKPADHHKRCLAAYKACDARTWSSGFDRPLVKKFSKGQ